jgi:DNA adenine methylase
MAGRRNRQITNSPIHQFQPLLKWAGGKRQLLPHLRRFYPPAFRNYIEPFLGSGAVFFDLHALGRLHNRQAILIDSNADLIGCYETVRDAPEQVADELDRLAEGHAAGGSTHYYAIRDERFNPRRDRLRQSDGRIAYTPDLAAMLIYLNRTGFNGLFRLNSRGVFNVPAGRYDRPRIADRQKLLHVASALAESHVRLVWGSFELALDVAAEHDFLYLDPPYAPISRTASFTSYTAGGFSATAQSRLRSVVVELARRGCAVLVSNSCTPLVDELYRHDPKVASAGLTLHRVPARRAVNCDAARRGPLDEYLITNLSAVAS